MSDVIYFKFYFILFLFFFIGAPLEQRFCLDAQSGMYACTFWLIIACLKIKLESRGYRAALFA